MTMRKLQSFFDTYYFEVIFFSVLLFFSFWLMFHTFSYENGSFFIASKAWSDFASHIPLIRSFSFGSNFPPQYPLFPGEPIHYHFMFYALVGTLEGIGLPIDFALNIPSALGFFALLVAIYLFAYYLFTSRAVSALSVLFFLFNGTLSFLYFFQKHPLSKNTLQDIVTNTTFPSFGPYDGHIVSAFWNFNIFTNQRHFAAALAFSYFLVLLFIFVTKQTKPLSYKFLVFLPKNMFSHHKKTMHEITEIVTSQPWVRLFLLGFILGGSFYFHLVAFTMTSFMIGMIALFFSKSRIAALVVLCIAALVAFPQYQYLNSVSSPFSLAIKLGFLTNAPVKVTSFATYWFYNLGLHIILIPIGFALAPRRAQKIFLCVLPIFIIGNVFQFSPEIAANHKFFNYFGIIGSMFSAFLLVWLWHRKIWARPVVIAAVCILLLSGIIDFFPVLNDGKMQLSDYPQNKTVAWIKNNTSPQSVFLNTDFLFNPASLAGRKIFLGWPYFAWSAGHNTTERNQVLKQILGNTDIVSACHLINVNHLDYIVLNKTTADEENFGNISLLYSTHFKTVYSTNEYDIKNLHSECNKFLK